MNDVAVIRGEEKTGHAKVATFTIGGTVAFAAALFWLFRHSNVPIVPDEIGYLAIAKYLVSGEALNVSIMPSYRFGQGILLVPAVVFGSTSTAIYNIGIAISCFMMACVPAVLIGIAYRFHIKINWKVVVASIFTAIFPAYFYHASTVWPETSFRLFFLVSIYLVASAWANKRAIFWLLAAISVVWLDALHPRAIGMFAVMLGLLASAHTRKKADALTVLAALAILACGFVTIREIQQHVNSVLWPGKASDVGRISTLLRSLVSGDGLWRLAIETTGQAWVLVAGSFGLYLIGLVHAAKMGYRHPGARPTLFFAIWASAAVFVASTVFMAVHMDRIDHVIYARYNDGASSLFVWLGILFVLEGCVKKSQAMWCAVVFVACAACLLMLTASMHVSTIVTPNIPALLWTGYIVPLGKISLFQIVMIASMGVLTVCCLLNTSSPMFSFVIFLLIIVGGDFVVARSLRDAHHGRQGFMDRSASAFDEIKGKIYLDKSESADLNVIFDQYTMIDKTFPWSNIVKDDIPIGAATIVSSDVRKNGYRCVARLPYDAVLLSHSAGEDTCNGNQNAISLVPSQPILFSDTDIPSPPGWSGAESWGRWTDGKMAELHFALPELNGAYELEFSTRGYIAGSLKEQRIGIRVNGKALPDWVYTPSSAIQLQRVEVPQGATSVDIEFSIPDALSPKQAGQSADGRSLGLGISAVCLAADKAVCLSK